MITKQEQFDLIIIGGGAAAFAGAIKANELKAKTLMVNTGLPLGGTCVNVGCVPSKTLLWAAETMHHARNHGIPGITLELKNFDFPKVIADELALVERLREEKYQKVLKHLESVTHIEGKAQFIGPKQIKVNGQTFTADKFLIAAGSTATVPAIEGIQESGFITHIEALKLKEVPKELIVVGAGPLGLEFSQIFSRFGSKVTILQRGPSIFPPGEKELTDRLQEVLVKEGLTIITEAEIKSAQKLEGKKVLHFRQSGKIQEVAGDEILLASGKTPNTQDLGLSEAGVEIDKRQAVKVNQFYQTSSPHIFAAGDVTNLPLRLEPTAGNEGTLAAENALSGTQKSIDYNSVPYTIFTDPQLAGVGLTEEQQLKTLKACACRTVSFADIPKAMIIRRTEGLIKMAIHPKTKQVMGVHILAPNAGELIAAAMMIVKNKNTIDDVTSSLPMFPTLSESIKIVALSFTKDISKLSCCV